jgi:hypothetical protein
MSRFAKKKKPILTRAQQQHVAQFNSNLNIQILIIVCTQITFIRVQTNLS